MTSYSLINTSFGHSTPLATNGYWPSFIITDKRDTIGDYIKKYGHWERYLIDDAMKHIRDGSHVLDIGANIGAWTIYMARNKSITVHSFEPFPRTYYNLCSNILINDAMNVQTYRCALSDEEDYGKTLPLFCIDENIGGTRLGHTDEYFQQSEFTCKLDFLDRIMTDEDISLIKIDVEGHEEKVLRGGEKLLRRCSPTIYMESWRCKPLEQKSLFEYLMTLGYTIEHIHDDDYRAIKK